MNRYSLTIEQMHLVVDKVTYTTLVLLFGKKKDFQCYFKCILVLPT